MWNDIHEAIYSAAQDCILDSEYKDQVDPVRFEELLVEAGFMIVPIEDPTNLRFGVEDDTLD